MKILTYISGNLTVINGYQFFSSEYEKPAFITGETFYYEPTLKITDGRELTQEEISSADNYIDSFVFPESDDAAVISTYEKKEHCVNNKGLYIGYIAPVVGSVVVDSEPIDKNTMSWDFEKKEWFEFVAVNKPNGTVINNFTTLDNVMCVRKSLLDKDFCVNSQTYDFDNKIFNVDIVIAKADIMNKLKMDFEKLVYSVVDVTAFGEMTSWYKQEKQARAWLLDNNTPTPFIDSLLLGRNKPGETKEILINKIIAKADAYETFYSNALGVLHGNMFILDGLTTLNELRSFQVYLLGNA